MMELKELERLLKMLRKQGVKAIKMGDMSIELDLSDLPGSPSQAPIELPSPLIGADGKPLTEEEILFYSSNTP